MSTELRPDPKLPDRFVGEFSFDGRNLDISVELDGASFDAVMGLASSALDSIVDLDSSARLVAAKKLLPDYNSNWREFIRTGPNGLDIEVSEPELDVNEFISRLEIVSLEVTGDSCLTLGYNAREMFAGHTVYVTSFDGVLFADANAQLFG